MPESTKLPEDVLQYLRADVQSSTAYNLLMRYGTVDDMVSAKGIMLMHSTGPNRTLEDDKAESKETVDLFRHLIEDHHISADQRVELGERSQTVEHLRSFHALFDDGPCGWTRSRTSPNVKLEPAVEAKVDQDAPEEAPAPQETTEGQQQPSETLTYLARERVVKEVLQRWNLWRKESPEGERRYMSLAAQILLVLDRMIGTEPSADMEHMSQPGDVVWTPAGKAAAMRHLGPLSGIRHEAKPWNDRGGFECTCGVAVSEEICRQLLREHKSVSEEHQRVGDWCSCGRSLRNLTYQEHLVQMQWRKDHDAPQPPPGQITMQSLGRGSGKTLGSQQIITDMVQHHIDLYGWAIEYVYDDGVTGLLDPTKAKLHFGGFDMVEARKFIEQLARGAMDDMPMRIDMHGRAKKIMGQT